MECAEWNQSRHFLLILWNVEQIHQDSSVASIWQMSAQLQKYMTTKDFILVIVQRPNSRDIWICSGVAASTHPAMCLLEKYICFLFRLHTMPCTMMSIGWRRQEEEGRHAF